MPSNTRRERDGAASGTRWSPAATMIVVLLGQLVFGAHSQDAAGFSKPVRIEGLYKRPDFGFSVQMPPALLAYLHCDREGICGSMHGFDGTVADEPSVEIYLFPEYDPTTVGRPRRFLRSNTDSLQHVLDGCHPPGISLSLVSSSAATLDTLPGLRVIANFIKPESKAEMTVEVVFGLRIVSRNETILYSMAIIAPSSQFSKNKPIFDSLIRSFKIEPIEK